MNYIGKCYRLLEDDEETIMQWPEIKTGFEFQILRVGNQYENEIGVTKLMCLKTSKIFDINFDLETPVDHHEEPWFWCMIHMRESKLEEIGDLPALPQTTKPGEIRLNHFHGRAVDIAYALSAFAAQEGCGSEEYDLMQAASEYIRHLESITAEKFANAVIEGELDDWAADSFNDESRDETQNTGYLIRTGVKQFIRGKQ